jgi:methylenetetrahydrofolate dehydrogenase (NADP+)/methenyltetrahydrofolate cyclohydrolase
MEIIDGRKISKEILAEVKVKVKTLDFKPVFCDILVGNDLVSLKYVELKKKKALELGIDFYDANFTENITTEELILEIEKINKIENMCGIIVQLPLPSHLDTQKILDTIEPSLDVDCLGEELSNKFYNGDLFIAPPTALACEALLESLNLDLLKKKILIIGEGKLVGKPMANILKFKNYNFDIINSKSENQETLIKEADVLITGVGRGSLITGDMVKEGVIVIDAGTSEEDSVLVGDVDFDSVSTKASFVTPVPGGVGPVTVAMLFSNVLKVAYNKKNE